MARAAEDLYTRAVDRDPALTEARLRRGRLLAHRGRVTEAARDLEWVAAQPADPRLRAVAHLLLARQADAQGQVDAALRHYRAASELAPGALSALVGQGELLSRTGRAREAAEELTRALSRRGTDQAADPWLAYHLGFHPRTADALSTLRVAGKP
jgi:tetratricopeptide (TPR) repeat protein